MAKEEKQNYAYIAIVAIVAIVALVILIGKGTTKVVEPVTFEAGDSNIAGQASYAKERAGIEEAPVEDIEEMNCFEYCATYGVGVMMGCEESGGTDCTNLGACAAQNCRASRCNSGGGSSDCGSLGQMN